MDRANEIQETMGRSYAIPDDLDEEALQAGASPFLSQPTPYAN